MSRVSAGWLPPDPSRIDLTDERVMSYWCAELGITTDILVVAVELAGPMTDDVREELLIRGLATSNEGQTHREAGTERPRRPAAAD
jgi:hypothetical protein